MRNMFEFVVPAKYKGRDIKVGKAKLEFPKLAFYLYVHPNNLSFEDYSSVPRINNIEVSYYDEWGEHLSTQRIDIAMKLEELTGELEKILITNY